MTTRSSSACAGRVAPPARTSRRRCRSNGTPHARRRWSPCLRHVRVGPARRAAAELMAALPGRTLAAHPYLRMRIIDLLVQGGAKDALPALRSLSSPFKLRRRDRQVARHARTAVRLLEQVALAEPAERYST